MNNTLVNIGSLVVTNVQDVNDKGKNCMSLRRGHKGLYGNFLYFLFRFLKKKPKNSKITTNLKILIANTNDRKDKECSVLKCWLISVIPAVERWKQEKFQESQASLGYTASPR